MGGGISGFKQDNKSAPEYDAAFDFRDPAAQLSILETVKELRNKSSLKIRSDIKCYVEDLVDYLNQSSTYWYPVVDGGLDRTGNLINLGTVLQSFGDSTIDGK